ncbi:MAG: hypothetical protein AAGU01_08035 [Clostridiaceae bacterium]
MELPRGIKRSSVAKHPRKDTRYHSIFVENSERGGEMELPWG